eukprot:scaffold222579_cov18-Tisochrysis_lutea.AAC.1
MEFLGRGNTPVIPHVRIGKATYRIPHVHIAPLQSAAATAASAAKTPVIPHVCVGKGTYRIPHIHTAPCRVQPPQQHLLPL